VVVHLSQELKGDWITGGRPNHGIDRAFRAERRLITINPLRNRPRRKCRRAIEAAAHRTPLDLSPMETAMLMRLDVRRIKPVRIKPDHVGRSNLQV
jgi:hypothetical protein